MLRPRTKNERIAFLEGVEEGIQDMTKAIEARSNPTLAELVRSDVMKVWSVIFECEIEDAERLQG